MAEGLTDTLPRLRVSPVLKARLEKIVAGSVSPRLSDHMRQALEEYVARHEREQRGVACDAVDETEKLMLALG